MVKGENLLNGECTKSKLWLVDLAGSERIAKKQKPKERGSRKLKISTDPYLHLVMSYLLLQLKAPTSHSGCNLLASLYFIDLDVNFTDTELASSVINTQNVCSPCRNSKLTHLLQDSLGTSLNFPKK